MMRLNTIKMRIKSWLWPITTFYLLVIRRRSYLRTSGWIESLKRGYPCNQKGEPVPWMNYSAINILDQMIRHDMAIFEFGSGYSTMFYAARAASVDSVETNTEWLETVKPKLPSNAKMMHVNEDKDGKYCRTVLRCGMLYDLIVIDGVDRVNCVYQSVNALSDRGVILLDDSQRILYKEALDFAEKLGFHLLHLQGLKPTGSACDRTTVLYRPHNCLGL